MDGCLQALCDIPNCLRNPKLVLCTEVSVFHKKQLQVFSLFLESIIFFGIFVFHVFFDELS